MYPINRLFNEIQNHLDHDFFELEQANQNYLPDFSGHGITGMNLYETENNLKFRFDVAGFKKEDLKIELIDDSLVLSGVRYFNKTEETKAYRSEKAEVKFKKSFKLTEKVETDSIKAHYENGVLEVELEKAEDVKPKLISIQ